LIQTKIVVNDAKRTIPKENIKNVEKKVSEAFDKHELPRMMKKANCTSRVELDQKLRTVGDSLDHQKQSFFEKTLAQQWMLEQPRKETSAEITHDEMVAHYRAHLADYEKPPKARWQQLMVRKSKDRPPGEAWQKLARMGNAVWYGASFAE